MLEKEVNWDLFTDDCITKQWGDEPCMSCENLWFCHENPDYGYDFDVRHCYSIYPFKYPQETIKEGVDYVPFEVTRHNRHLIGYGVKNKDSRYYEDSPTFEQIIPDTFKHNDTDYLITSIGEDGFFHCDELCVVSIPHTVEKMERDSFNECYHLEVIYIGKGLRYFNARFLECPELVKIKVHPDNPYFCDVDGVLFSKDMKVLIRYPEGKKGEEYEIPESVEEIASFAFYGNRYLKRIKMSDNVRIIRESVFRCTKQLYYLELSKNLEVLDVDVFLNHLDNLKEIHYRGTKEKGSILFKDVDLTLGFWYKGEKINILYIEQ